MPDDPIQPEENKEPSQPEPQAEEVKPVEENPKPEENSTPEQPKAAATSDVEETPAEIPAPIEPEPEQKADEPKTEEPKPSEEQKHEESKPNEPSPAEASAKEGEIKIVEREVIKEVKVVDEAELGKRLDYKFKEKLLENKKKANEARIQRKKNNLDKIVELAKKKEINNQDVRDLLQVSQSTATTYLTELAKSGRLKSEGKAKSKVYRS